jgi:hypothetical protein
VWLFLNASSAPTYRRRNNPNGQTRFLKNGVTCPTPRPPAEGNLPINQTFQTVRLKAPPPRVRKVGFDFKWLDL